MARNEEKANGLFNRWVTMRHELTTENKHGKRPFLASECKNLSDAEHWRRELIKEIVRKVSEIQNPGLGEHKLRDLNDEINKKMREKRHWERQIGVLGGVAHTGSYLRLGDAGIEVPGGGGYRYFGAAKELPGVKELFAAAESVVPKRTRDQVSKRIDIDYFGFRDEDDSDLLEAEASAEATARAAAIESWEREALERQLGGGSLPPDDEGDCAFEEGVDIDEATSRAAAAAAAAELEHKKQLLLKQISGGAAVATE